MSPAELEQVARALVAPGKGILAIDETVATCTKRFLAAGIESTPESRLAYREMLCTAPGASDFISGAILYDETIRQETGSGRPFPEMLARVAILPGIKVDTGAKALAGSPDETITEGLDGLRDRLNEYREMGARFTKWRAVIRIGDKLPTPYCIGANAHALGRYAALAQEAGLVPIVEPEVLMNGTHGIDVDQEVTETVLRTVFNELTGAGVALEGIVLKPNMVTAGDQSGTPMDTADVAAHTIETLRRCVPAVVPGIAFLSGGQSGEESCANLGAMARDATLPWQLSYSFGRALQYPALEVWGGEERNIPSAQSAFLHRARMSSLARDGQYRADMEREAA
jgi:fructose-bisphosphate aldolase class I